MPHFIVAHTNGPQAALAVQLLQHPPRLPTQGGVVWRGCIHFGCTWPVHLGWGGRASSGADGVLAVEIGCNPGLPESGMSDESYGVLGMCSSGSGWRVSTTCRPACSSHVELGSS